MKLRQFLAPACAGLITFYFNPLTALAQGTTAFTYQGRLLNNGTEVNGTNGMVFTLYSAQTGGTVIGTPITNSVAVSNGLFTEGLDFGANAFNGSARWLDIAVSNGTTNIELSPRTQVLPTPYAVYAASAATAGTAASATTAGTATNIVGGVVASGTFAGNGSGLTNVAANLRMEVFTSSGTFVVPSNVWTIIVEAWGGGGGGGAGNSSSSLTGGGGGGAGGYAKVFYDVVPNASYTVTVGLGGSAGIAGGSTAFAGITLATGGAAGSTDITPVTPGGAGGSGSVTSSTASAIKGGTGRYGTVDGGGDGGSAGCGGAGGLGNLSGTATGGSAGITPGGGGGGGDFTGTLSGYAGGNGEVIVYY